MRLHRMKKERYTQVHHWPSCVYTRVHYIQVTYTYIIAWALQLSTLAFIRLLPRQKLEVQQMRYYGGYSMSGGWLVVAAMVGGLAYVSTANLMSLFESSACLRMAGGSGC